VAAGNGSGYLFLVTLSHGDTGTLNRQQLLGSMPKMLDGLEQGDAITIRLIDQAMFAQLIQQLLAHDVNGAPAS
jgi:hypothetical protein